MTDEPVLLTVDGPVATVTLNRPAARNALDGALLTGLADALATADADDAVHAIVLTGADPAFCAGLDLKALGDPHSGLHDVVFAEPQRHRPWASLATPLIGAVNGPAITGGLELALNCDLLICSERAVFADTHARVGVLPGWGLTVLLPLAVGRAMARQMSLTGDFVTAEQALRAGLVSEVLPHGELPGRAQRLAATIAGNDARAVRALLASYRGVEAEFVAGGYRVEEQSAAAWQRDGLDLAESGRRRAAVTERGRGQAL